MTQQGTSVGAGLTGLTLAAFAISSLVYEEFMVLMYVLGLLVILALGTGYIKYQ